MSHSLFSLGGDPGSLLKSFNPALEFNYAFPYSCVLSLHRAYMNSKNIYSVARSSFVFNLIKYFLSWNNMISDKNTKLNLLTVQHGAHRDLKVGVSNHNSFPQSSYQKSTSLGRAFNTDIMDEVQCIKLWHVHTSCAPPFSGVGLPSVKAGVCKGAFQLPAPELA